MRAVDGRLQAITLVESSRPQDREAAQALLNELLPHTGKSLRVGITGVPGVGKSTFIESFGQHVIAKGHKVAVLAVDPSSPWLVAPFSVTKPAWSTFLEIHLHSSVHHPLGRLGRCGAQNARVDAALRSGRL